MYITTPATQTFISGADIYTALSTANPFMLDISKPVVLFPSGFSMPMNHFEEMCKSFMSKNYPEELI